MPKTKKSPQEKKRLELKEGHFTFSEYPHAFRKQWKRKKTQANREKRRKSDEAFQVWQQKLERITAKLERPARRKLEQKKTPEGKIKPIQRQNRKVG